MSPLNRRAHTHERHRNLELICASYKLATCTPHYIPMSHSPLHRVFVKRLASPQLLQQVNCTPMGDVIQKNEHL
eukprot:scaffold3535_cov107-Isochrysis_galbana.AAC.1